MNRSQAKNRRGVALLAGLSLLATAACGSTAPTSGQTVLGGGQVPGQATDPLVSDGLGGGELGGDGVAPADGATGGGFGSSDGSSSSGAGSSQGAVGSGGSSGGGAGGSAQAPASGSGTAPGGAGSSTVAHGPGVTDTSIFLGIPYCTDCSAADAALGGDGEDSGDQRRYFQAALDDVNSRGGVLGRKLVPVFHAVSVSDDLDRSAQAACETFTKDNKVAAMFLRGEIAYQCAKNAGIIVDGQGGSGPLFERYPNMFAPATIRLERLGAVTVKGMVAAGWHKPTPKWPTGKIGLITWQDREYEYAMKQGWLPALAEKGLKETEVRYVNVPQSNTSIADSSAAINAAVLSFADQKIDHVFIADGPAGIFKGGGLTFQFLNSAQSQGYFPRYGFNSNNAPGSPNYPADQQVGMVAVNSNDFERANDEGIALNPQRERCYQLMTKKGLKATDGRPTGVLAISACGVAWFTEAVFKRATAGTTLPQVIAAAESLGTSYRSPGQYGTRLGPGRHDGVAFFRNAGFDESCSCMKYTSKPYEP